MKNLIAGAIANTFSFLKKLKLERYFAAVLLVFLLLTTNMNMTQDDQSLGERIRERIQQTDQNSERPKTTGQLLDEARGDVPLGERMRNITRDSAEAFNQFGKEYSVGAQESARNIRDKAMQAGQEAADQIQR